MLSVKEFFHLIQPYLGFKRFLIAFSGGLDSTVLLHLFKQIKEQYHASFLLEAIHINHQLQSHSWEWEKKCERLCNEWNIPLSIKTITVQSKALGLEAAAREARYQAFTSVIQLEDVLLTAHHQDDQAETIFLQLMRGTGLAGLSGMSIIKPLGLGMHLRPLLNYTRNQLEEYAKYHNLFWIEDESNQSLDIQRNFIRQKVFPLLQSRWPALKQTLARTSQNCGEAKRSLEYFSSHSKLFDDINLPLDALHIEYENAKYHHLPLFNIRKDWQKLSLYQIDIDKLTVLPIELQHLYIKEILENLAIQQKNNQRNSYQHQSHAPSRQMVEKIFSEVIQADSDATPELHWEPLIIRRYQRYLYIFPANLKWEQQNQTYIWHLQNQASINFLNYKLTYFCKKGLGLSLPEEAPTLKIRTRKGGETIFWHGHRRKLKTLFQDWQIAPWLRNLIPLIFYNNELNAVAGYAIADTYIAQPNEIGYVLKAQKIES